MSFDRFDVKVGEVRTLLKDRYGAAGTPCVVLGIVEDSVEVSTKNSSFSMSVYRIIFMDADGIIRQGMSFSGGTRQDYLWSDVIVGDSL